MRLTAPHLPRALRFVGALALALAVAGLPLMVAGPADAATQSVKIGDNLYDPTTINVAVGDTVTWTNSGKVEHTVTSEVGVWDSGHIKAGGTYSLVFSSPGTYFYYCTVHPREMRARVVVGNGMPNYGNGMMMSGGGYGQGGYGQGGYGQGGYGQGGYGYGNSGYW